MSITPCGWLNSSLIVPSSLFSTAVRRIEHTETLQRCTIPNELDGSSASNPASQRHLVPVQLFPALPSCISPTDGRTLRRSTMLSKHVGDLPSFQFGEWLSTCFQC